MGGANVGKLYKLRPGCRLGGMHRPPVMAFYLTASVTVDPWVGVTTDDHSGTSKPLPRIPLPEGSRRRSLQPRSTETGSCLFSVTAVHTVFIDSIHAGHSGGI